MQKVLPLSGLLHGFLEGFCLGDQLIDIFDPRLGLLRFLCLQLLHITGKLNNLFQGFTDCIGSALLFSPWIKDTKSLIFPAALPMDGTSSTTRRAS